jgi:hypothetical protein
MPTDKFDYLILLNAPYKNGHSEPVREAMDKAEAELGISAWLAPVPLRDEESPRTTPDDQRMFFSLEKSTADDVRAQAIAEAVILTAELDSGPLRMLGEEEITIRIRRPLPFSRNAYSSAKRITQLVADPIGHGPYVENEIYKCLSTAPEPFATGWACASTILGNPKLHSALAFYSAGIRRFFMTPSQLVEAELNNSKLGSNLSILAAAEGAFQDMYKAIEAIIGQPPSDDKKLILKLLHAGCDPFADVGFGEKLNRLEAIRRVERIRNSRAAHGGSPDRGLAVLEIVACQIWAKEIIRANLEHLEGSKSVERWFTRQAS